MLSPSAYGILKVSTSRSLHAQCADCVHNPIFGCNDILYYNKMCHLSANGALVALLVTLRCRQGIYTSFLPRFKTPSNGAYFVHTQSRRREMTFLATLPRQLKMSQRCCNTKYVGDCRSLARTSVFLDGSLHLKQVVLISIRLRNWIECIMDKMYMSQTGQKIANKVK